MDEYKSYINSGLEAWWNKDSHDGVYVLMTKKYTEENALTYSREPYSKGLTQSEITDEAGKPETVSTEWSIGIPAEYMPNTKAVRFNADTYREKFKELMVASLEQALKDGKLASTCGAAVRSEYNNSSTKQKMLETYADNVLNTVIYKIACDVMKANNTWVANVITTYKQYCDNIMKRDSGINAFLNYIFLTHAFEGEVSGDIENFLGKMTVQVGFYGVFALTCAGQDSLQDKATKDKLREYFVNTVTSLANRKSKALTGFNNYCYITGTILEAGVVEIKARMYVNRTDSGISYTGCSAKPWTAAVPSIVNSVYLPIIYKQYTKLPH